MNQALLGTQPGDLAGFVSNLDVVARELNANSTDLQGLITNFNTVSGDFAAHQASLRDAIVELPKALAVGRPALFQLNQDFPALRAFAREALPGVKSANSALDYANPWIGQLRQLISKSELRGLVEDLRPTVPDLAALSNDSLPFLEQARALSSCFNNVVIPWSNTTIPNTDSDPAAGKVFQEFAWGLTGVAGESRSGDANGQEFRVLGGGGSNTHRAVQQPRRGRAADRRRPLQLPRRRSPRSSPRPRPRSGPTCRARPRIRLISAARSARRRRRRPAARARPSASPRENSLDSRYADILSQLTDYKQLKAAGKDNAAQQLLDKLLPAMDQLAEGLDRHSSGPTGSPCRRPPRRGGRRADAQGDSETTCATSWRSSDC